ncbi:MAG: SpoIID/LytB domain-containing protein, partial [Firmicutes bacterium]|nr:SpoIID/LytB domain-containing protein [Bacillota bacterium]
MLLFVSAAISKLYVGSIPPENTVLSGEPIRVLISESGYTGYIHEQPELSGGFWLEFSGRREYFSKLILNEENAGDYFGAERSIAAIPEKGKLRLDSVLRADGVPHYAGKLEITLCEGGFYIVNEISLEEYLCAVLPGEMPSSFGPEAAKAQAVCARSYALC